MQQSLKEFQLEEKMMMAVKLSFESGGPPPPGALPLTLRLAPGATVRDLRAAAAAQLGMASIQFRDLNEDMDDLELTEGLLIDGSVFIAANDKEDGAVPLPQGETKAGGDEEEEEGGEEDEDGGKSAATAAPAKPDPRRKSTTLADRQARADLSCVLDGILWVSGQQGASSRAAMQEVGITHVLNCCSRIKCRFRRSFKYRVVEVFDTKGADVSKHFEEAIGFMDEAQEAGGRCLVHCLVGASRSVSLALAYMMKRHGMSLRDAFTLCRTRRKVARPNRSFARQLIEYEAMLQNEGGAAAAAAATPMTLADFGY
eukprot:g798.t1